MGHFGLPNRSKFKLALCIKFRLWNSPWSVPMAVCRLFHSLSSCANRRPTVTYWDNGACTKLLLNLNQTKWSPWLFRSETVSRYDYGVPYIDLGGQGHLMLLLSQRNSINISLHTGTHWSYFYKCVDSCFSYSFRVLLGVFLLCAPKTHFWSSS